MNLDQAENRKLEQKHRELLSDIERVQKVKQELYRKYSQDIRALKQEKDELILEVKKLKHTVQELYAKSDKVTKGTEYYATQTLKNINSNIDEKVQQLKKQADELGEIRRRLQLQTQALEARERELEEHYALESHT